MTQPTPPADPSQTEVDAIIAILGRIVPAGYLTSVVRTAVPAGLAALLSWAAVHFHVAVGTHPSPTLVAATVFGVNVVLYAGARWLENRQGNRWWAKAARGAARVLLSLGVPTTPPTYPTAPTAPGQ